jgi:CRP/FNR family transcriptional regulator, cyclic AMP receptor protein
MYFSDLTAEERKLVDGIGKVFEYQKDDVILLENTEGFALYLLLKGKVHVRKKLESDKYIILIELGPGDMFGEMSFLALNPRSASVVALEACKVMAIEQSDFQKLIDKNPAIGVKVYRSLARELALRLGRNTEELRRAMLWALEEMHGLDRCLRP